MDFDNYIEQERIKTDLQEKKIIHYCDNCKGNIYEGNEFYVLEGFNLCEECFDKYQMDEKEKHRCIAGEEVWED